MKEKLLEFFKDESGQTSTEYILLVAVVALIVFRFKKTATDRLSSLTDGIFTAGDNVLKDINEEVGQ